MMASGTDPRGCHSGVPLRTRNSREVFRVAQSCDEAIHFAESGLEFVSDLRGEDAGGGKVVKVLEAVVT